MADIYDVSSYTMGNVLDTDIGIMNMNKMITVPSFVNSNPYFGTMNGMTIQGNLSSDKVQLTSRKEKDKNFIKSVLIGAGILGAAFCTYKFGKAGLTKLWAGMKSLAGKIKGKFKKP